MPLKTKVKQFEVDMSGQTRNKQREIKKFKPFLALIVMESVRSLAVWPLRCFTETWQQEQLLPHLTDRDVTIREDKLQCFFTTDDEASSV